MNYYNKHLEFLLFIKMMVKKENVRGGEQKENGEDQCIISTL